MKLCDLGLTTNQSKRWQLQARVPEDMFCEHLAQTRQAGKELTSAGLLRLAKRLSVAPVASGHAAGRIDRLSRGRRHCSEFGGSVHETWKRRPRRSAAGELIAEIRDHHNLLNGILQPVYSGDATALHPAELRMLRYLMKETDSLLAQLEGMQPDAPEDSRRPVHATA